MSATSRSKSVVMILGVVVALAAAGAFLKRDAIAGLILKGGDTALTGEPAQSSPQAQVALEFLTALRAGDLEAMTRLGTPELAARLREEANQSASENEDLKATMLADLPADPAALRGLIKSVQVHESRGVVTFETRTNSWFLTLEEQAGTWKVSGY